MIDKSSVNFLQGVIDSFSMIIDSDISLACNEVLSYDCKVSLLEFYNFLPIESIISIVDFDIYKLEDIFYERLFLNNFISNLAESRKRYISYKIMDYLIFCLQNSADVEIKDWQVKKIDFEYKEVVSTNFTIFRPKHSESLLLTFWGNNKN